jgi:hypothetical protein
MPSTQGIKKPCSASADEISGAVIARNSGHIPLQSQPIAGSKSLEFAKERAISIDQSQPIADCPNSPRVRMSGPLV